MEFRETRSGVNAAVSGDGIKNYPPLQANRGARRDELFAHSRSRTSVEVSFGKHSKIYASLKYERNLDCVWRRNVFGEADYRFSW